MALFAGLFLALQVAFPQVVRPHFIPVMTESREMTADGINSARSMGTITGAPRVGGLHVEDAWVSSSSDLLTRTGEPVSAAEFNRCYSQAPEIGAEGTFGDIAVCFAKLDLHVDIEYQPNSRYWTFQLIELLIYTSLVLIAIALSSRMYVEGRPDRAN